MPIRTLPNIYDGAFHYHYTKFSETLSVKYYQLQVLQPYLLTEVSKTVI